MRDDLPLFPPQGSTLAPEVDLLFFASLGVAIFFSLLIAVLITVFAIRFKRRHPDQVGIPEKTSLPLELTWTAIPLAIALALFAWGARVFFHASRPPTDAVEYFAVGKQWMWKFQHPEGNREINDLHVPVGLPIKITMTSEDVIHSLFIPAFRVKADALPGRYTTLWFEATKTGVYPLYCTEYCGVEHSQMIGRVFVMEPTEYERWLAGARNDAPMTLTGEALFTAHSCQTCHRLDSAARAPRLAGIVGRERPLASGATVIADDAYLRRSILQPASEVVAGYDAIMPPYQGQLSEEALLGLLRYIKELEAPPGELARSTDRSAEPAPEEGDPSL